MLRIVHPALGQSDVPYADLIARIVRSFPPCFTSRSILKVIKNAQRLAKTAPAQTDGDKAQMYEAWSTLEYWRTRLSSEPESTYCIGTTNGSPTQDREIIIGAVVKPYIIASGISGVAEADSEAVTELFEDLSAGTYNPGEGFHMPSWLPDLPNPLGLPEWVPWAFIGGAVLLFAFRFGRRPTQVVIATPKSETPGGLT